jgi:uncharacterized membrane protein YheB (UPF0754 family)
MDWSSLWVYVSPPIAGAIIGYFTNDLAIKMLFRPYRTLYFAGRRIPFTPGLIPRNQERLAKRVSDTIMGSLLTPSELQNLTRRLLQPERVRAGIEWLLRLAIEQVRTDKDRRTTGILAGILRDLVGESLPRLLRVLSRREDLLGTQLNNIFDRVLLEFQLSDEQAGRLADWLLQVVLPPDAIRQLVIDLLTDRTIQIIDESFREKTSGTYWVVANLFGLRNTLTRLRTFCLDEREVTNTRIKESIQALQVRDRLKAWLKSLSLQNLPVSTVRQLRNTIRETIISYYQTHGTEFIQGFSESIDWDNTASVLLSRLRNSPAFSSSLTVVSQELSLILERYLEQDLENLVAQAIPILSIDRVIIDRVKSTSPADLETAIEGIVKNELQAIVNLGGALGFVVGLLQAVLLLFQQIQ